MIDLQIHSNYSDGSNSPTELVQLAKELDLHAIALTDHDTVEGIPEFLQAGEQFGINTVPGVEISVDTDLPANGHVHMLGLFVDSQDRELRQKLDFLRNHRIIRAEKMVKKLNNLGIDTSFSEVLEEAGEGSIGRPHIAKILLKKGYVSTLQSSFYKYIGKGRPAFVEKVKFRENEAIQMIKDSGGLAILAHPHIMNYPNLDKMLQKVLELQACGLDGVEVYYPGMPVKVVQALTTLVEEHDLLISGGSDFHGENKEGISMGSGRGDLNIPDQVYEDLKNRWETLRLNRKYAL
jgi:predicted metal-dependent phosphoesterase TrpH